MAEDCAVALDRTTENKWKMPPISVFFKHVRNVFKLDPLGTEILRIALPAALALAADPIASLIDTAFIGYIGPVELAAVGVSIAIFNQASKITIFPLVSITTSFVAQEDTEARIANEEEEEQEEEEEDERVGGDSDDEDKGPDLSAPESSTSTNAANCSKTAVDHDLTTDPMSNKDDDDHDAFEKMEEGGEHHVDSSTIKGKQIDPLPNHDGKLKVGVLRSGKRHIPSATTALLLGAILGLLQTLFLIFGAKTLLGIMGVKQGSPMLKPPHKYLILRSLGAPAMLLSLAATLVGDGANIVLDAILIFVCKFGVSGAAIAHVISQYFMSFILLWKLMKEVHLLPPSIKDLQLSRFLKNGFYLLTRVIAATFCVTLAASLAARLGETAMAAFQICLQVWSTSSLLADALAVAAQAILASSFAEKNYKKAAATVSRVLQMSIVLGLGLAILVGIGLRFGDVIFSKDISVLHLITIGVPVNTLLLHTPY